MSMTPEDRQWKLLFDRLDRIEDKQDRMLTKQEFKEFEKEVEEKFGQIEDEVEEIKDAAISPSQITTMIGEGMQRSEARGWTTQDRRVRYGVALISVGTFVILVIQTLRELTS